MSTKFVDKGNSTVEITVTLDEKIWKENNEKAVNKLAENVSIKGFRKGKAPIAMAKEHINPADLINEAVNISLPGMYETALTENKVSPFGNPEVNVTKVNDKELEVVFTVTTMPKITLGVYKGLEVEPNTIKVSKEEVDSSIAALLDKNADLILKEGAAELGDTVVLDFKGYVDGKEFEGGAAENFELVLGSGQFIPGFEDQLVGAQAESKVDVNVKFPENYVKDLAGKEAKFVCQVHEIKTKQNPELNGEFVEGLGIDGVTTVDELEKHQIEVLKAQKNQEENNRVFMEILNKIIEKATFEMSDKIVENEAAGMKQNMINQIQQNGITFEQYKEITGMDDEKIMAELKKEAEQRLKEYLTLYTIGAQEKITVTDEDVNSYYETVAKQYGIDVEQVKTVYEKQIDNVKSNLLQSKIEKFVLENNIKAAAAKTEEK